MSDSVNARFVCEPQAVPAARRALESVAHRLTPALRQRLSLLVSELVTNSIKHSGGGADATIALRVSLQPEAVRAEVADAGPGFRPRGRRGGLDRPGGWGLVLVEQLADRWGVERGRGTRVWIELDRRDEPQAGAA